jgi:phosphoglycolate phosphatase
VTPAPPPTAVLFDMDGTLADSRPGIVTSMRATLLALGLPVPPEAELVANIGPPLHETFSALLGRAQADVEDVVAAYRARYAQEMLAGTHVYPGIPELLARLHDAGHPLAVATSKAQPLAVALLGHLGLAGRFAAIRGPVPPSREQKAGTVARALAALGVPAGGNAILVGDRRHDVDGGRANGLRVVGAAWGYGTRAELEAAGAAGVAETAADVPAFLQSSGSAIRAR